MTPRLSRESVRPTRSLIYPPGAPSKPSTDIHEEAGFLQVFPKDLGGHSSDGPPSVWSLRQFQLLEGVSDARRDAGSLPIRGALNKVARLVFLSNYRGLHDALSMEWSQHQQVGDTLTFEGPQPKHCRCAHPRKPKNT